jgi:protoporphyrinogen oxidase
MTNRPDVLILGAGVTGLAAAWDLADRAVVLDRASRPGGLVRTSRLGDYWFDQVLHLLYFQDPTTETRVRGLLGNDLAPCAPRAWCETSAGTTLFPFQMHLGGLDPEARDRCVHDLIEVSNRHGTQRATNFEEHLLGTFGQAMCDVFLFPYNRKMWKRPLRSLAPSGFTWNITPPKLVDVLRGAREGKADFQAYNSAGWYPRPAASSPIRGMEVLSARLATQARDLRTDCSVEAVYLNRREVVVRHHGRPQRFHWNEALLSTIPLPSLVSRCPDLPTRLRHACARLPKNRVLSVGLSVQGTRPELPGHWRYYADESLIFTRLVFLHEFDPQLAPAKGWPLLVEITEPAEWPMQSRSDLMARIRRDLERAKALPPGSRIVGELLITVDPAYVVFDVQSQKIVQMAHELLSAHGVTSLGRYGRWEYSSMAGCMRDGFAWAERLQHGAERLGTAAPAIAAS